MICIEAIDLNMEWRKFVHLKWDFRNSESWYDGQLGKFFTNDVKNPLGTYIWPSNALIVKEYKPLKKLNLAKLLVL